MDIVVQSQLPERQRRESTLPATGDEARFLEIIKETPINKSVEKDISDALKYAFVKVGLRERDFPVPEEKLVLLNHLINYYGNHSPNEIRLAFDLAMIGILNVEVNCYANFSCLYLSTIMNAYRIWAAQVHHQHTETKPVMSEKNEPMGDSTYLAWLMDLKNRRYSVEFMPPMLCKWAAENNITYCSNTDKWEYLNKAIAYTKSKLSDAALSDPSRLPDLKQFNECIARGYFTGALREQMITLASQMILFDYLYEGKNAGSEKNSLPVSLGGHDQK